MRSNKHLCIFPIDSGNQEKRKVLSVEIDVGFLVTYFLLLFQRQTTHTPLRHTSEQHVQRRVKQNGRLEKYCSQSPGHIERTHRYEFELKWVISLFAFVHFHWLFIFTRLASRSLDLFLYETKKPVEIFTIILQCMIYKYFW